MDLEFMSGMLKTMKNPDIVQLDFKDVIIYKSLVLGAGPILTTYDPRLAPYMTPEEYSKVINKLNEAIFKNQIS